MLAARMSAARRHQLCLRAALLAAVVLLLGLPRLLVLCTHADGEASLEWAHPEGTCCHAPNGSDEPHEPGPALAPGGSCDHNSLSVDTAPPPPNFAPAPPPLEPAFGAAPFVPAEPPANAALRRPPPTGPPRTDRRAALRSTSLLLL